MCKWTSLSPLEVQRFLSPHWIREVHAGVWTVSQHWMLGLPAGLPDYSMRLKVGINSVSVMQLVVELKCLLKCPTQNRLLAEVRVYWTEERDIWMKAEWFPFPKWEVDVNAIKYKVMVWQRNMHDIPHIPVQSVIQCNQCLFISLVFYHTQLYIIFSSP